MPPPDAPPTLRRTRAALLRTQSVRAHGGLRAASPARATHLDAALTALDARPGGCRCRPLARTSPPALPLASLADWPAHARRDAREQSLDAGGRRRVGRWAVARPAELLVAHAPCPCTCPCTPTHARTRRRRKSAKGFATAGSKGASNAARTRQRRRVCYCRVSRGVDGHDSSAAERPTASVVSSTVAGARLAKPTLSMA